MFKSTPLKILVPILVLSTGILTTIFNIYVYVTTEHEQQLENLKQQVSIIGNRITNDIEKRGLYYSDHHADLIRIISQYTIENLVVAKTFNDLGKPMFESTPVTSRAVFGPEQKAMIDDVMKEQRVKLHIDQDKRLVDAVFPLALPIRQGELYAKHYGALYLAFDLNEHHQKMLNSVYRYAIINALMVFLMVIVLMILMYRLILRRLTNLHQAVLQMTQGDMSIQLHETRNDELGAVKNAFNTMASQISSHQHELQVKIDEAIRKNSEQNHILVQQSRFAAMGEMINNIAHQWRQPLNALALVLQKLQIFGQRGALNEEVIDGSVAKGMHLIEKMSSTIDDFRDFFKTDKPEQVFSLKTLTEDLMMLMEGTHEHFDIEVVIDFDSMLWMTTYKNELMQVLLNLMNNAKDALVENVESGRKIYLKSYETETQIILEVEDNAGGIPDDVVSKIFDPYFTTKEEGKGTGIGLYMSKTIIEDHIGGSLSVEKGVSGARFIIAMDIDIIRPFCSTEDQK